MTSHFLRLALTLTALLCLYTEHVTEAKDLTGNSNIQFVRELYNNVRDTMPSEVNAVENTQTIQNRLKCYEENHDYGQRIQICNNKYVKSLCATPARESIRAPVLANLCSMLICAPFFTISAWVRRKTTKNAAFCLKGSA